MKKNVRVLSLIGVVLVLVIGMLSCHGLQTQKTSLVTITVDARRTATVDIRRSSFWPQLKRMLSFLGDGRAAVAQVPAAVSAVRATVTGAGMQTIVRTQDAAGQNSVSMEIEVPNGKGRNFLVEGLNANGATIYSGQTVADLTGVPTTLAIVLTPAIASGRYVNILTGSDVPGCGGAASPCRTISYALSQSPGNESIVVSQGSYSATVGAGGGETFPLQLKAGTSLVCTGAGFSTVIDNSAGPDSTIILGAAGAVVDGCGIITFFNGNGGSNYPAIDDAGSAMTVQNCSIADGDPFAMGVTGINLSADSTVQGSTIIGFKGPDGGGAAIRASLGALVTGNTITGAWYAVYVSAGTSTVSNNSLTSNTYGVNLLGGTPTIVNNTISSNASYGLVTQGTATPLISGNTIVNNGTGISLWAGSPTITGNFIHHNTNGIYVIGGTPSINNNEIYCNNTVSTFINYGDVYVSIPLTAGLMTNNAWDHDGTTNPQGPTVGMFATNGCAAGTDICVIVTPLPSSYTPFSPAVAGGCL